MPSSSAALVKLPWRAAASKARTAGRGGSACAMMDQYTLCMPIDVRLESNAFPTQIEGRYINRERPPYEAEGCRHGLRGRAMHWDAGATHERLGQVLVGLAPEMQGGDRCQEASRTSAAR